MVSLHPKFSLAKWTLEFLHLYPILLAPSLLFHYKQAHLKQVTSKSVKGVILSKMKDEDLTAVFWKGKDRARDLGHWVDGGRLRRLKRNVSCTVLELFLCRASLPSQEFIIKGWPPATEDKWLWFLYILWDTHINTQKVLNQGTPQHMTTRDCHLLLSQSCQDNQPTFRFLGLYLLKSPLYWIWNTFSNPKYSPLK